MPVPRWFRAVWGVVAGVNLLAAAGLYASWGSILVLPLVTGRPSPAVAVLFGDASGPFLLFTAVSGFVGMVSIALLGLSIADVAMSKGLSSGQRLLRIVVTVLALQLGLFLYWLLWGRKAPSPLVS